MSVQIKVIEITEVFVKEPNVSIAGCSGKAFKRRMNIIKANRVNYNVYRESGDISLFARTLIPAGCVWTAAKVKTDRNQKKRLHINHKNCPDHCSLHCNLGGKYSHHFLPNTHDSIGSSDMSHYCCFHRQLKRQNL